MVRYSIDKPYASKSTLNRELIEAYIENHGEGHRVFQGDFTDFRLESMLTMLGCRVVFRKTPNGKYSYVIESVHVYENDSDAMMTLINALE